MNRRDLLRALASAAATWPFVGRHVTAAADALSAREIDQLRAIASCVLPTELGPAGRTRVVDEFVAWLRDYREGAAMDHGYGVTELRTTPPSPARAYPAQLAALEREALDRGASLASLDPAARRAIVEASIEASRIRALPPRPDGAHVAVDLMSFYFQSSEANDVAYRAEIGRDSCRGMAGSDARPKIKVMR